MPRRLRPHVNPLGILKEHSFEGFGNARPLIIDVGSCKGEFAAALIEQFPEKNFLLFEIRVPLFKKLQKQFQGLPNVRVFDGDAGRNFRALIDPCQKEGILVEEIFVNFPDPWPKARHHKRRFITESFLSDAAEYLTPETTFVFQTDQKHLFEDTIEIVQGSAFDHIEYFDSSPYDTPTDWESAKVAEGCPIYRMRFRKTR